MVYDAESDRVILWEGEGAETDNVWTYDYNSNIWIEHISDEDPSLIGFEGFGAMVYDSESDRAISFGGGFYQGTDTTDATLAYDFNTDTWTDMEPEEVPGKRTVHDMAYNSALDLVVLFGGREGYGRTYTAETWVYDFNANTWTNMTLGQE
jgi:hypothetical protein